MNQPSSSKPFARHHPYRVAAHGAILALVLQVLMPLAHALAAPPSSVGNDTSRSIVQICTAFGIKTSPIAAPGDEAPAPKATLAWDCPLCLNHISALTSTTPAPHSRVTAFGAAFGQPVANIFVAALQAPSPHLPRAPPV